MRLIKKGIVLISVLIISLGCAREGFKASLGQNSSATSSTTENEPSNADKNALVFEMDVGEFDQDGVFLYYALPRATSSTAETAAQQISEKIHTAVFALQDQIVGDKDLYKLTVYDALTRNDGTYYSVMYDIKYAQTKDAEKEKYCFGLAFDSATGELIGLDAVMKTDALVALLLDEQSSKILEKDEALAAKQRAYLSQQGNAKLKERLTYPNGVVSLDRLLDASFYLDGTKLIAVFAAPQDIGGVIRVSVSL